MCICVCLFSTFYSYMVSSTISTMQYIIHCKQCTTPSPEFGKGQLRSALMGSLRISCFLQTFWILPLTYFYIPKGARAYLFPQSVKHRNFCSDPTSVNPICPQPRRPRRRSRRRPRRRSRRRPRRRRRSTSSHRASRRPPPRPPLERRSSEGPAWAACRCPAAAAATAHYSILCIILSFIYCS